MNKSSCFTNKYIFKIFRHLKSKTKDLLMDDFMLLTILLYDFSQNKRREDCWHLFSEVLKHNFCTDKKKYLKSKLYWKTVSMEALCTCAGVPACRRWESISDRERLNILSSPSRKLFLRLFQNSLFLWPLQWHCPLHVHIAHWNTTPQSITLQPKGKKL